MQKKYKFILTLPYDIEVDSAETIEGHMSFPNYSHADPVFYKGVFDSYDDAKKYASDFKIYKYVSDRIFYDSFEGEYEPIYFVSIFDAEDAAAAEFGIEPGDKICPHPNEYRVEEIDVDGDVAYKYCFYYNGDVVFDSYDEDDIYFDSYEDAENEADAACQEYEIEEEGEIPYKLETVEILSIRIEEFEVPSVEIKEFEVDKGVLVKYNGDSA